MGAGEGPALRAKECGAAEVSEGPGHPGEVGGGVDQVAEELEVVGLLTDDEGGAVQAALGQGGSQALIGEGGVAPAHVAEDALGDRAEQGGGDAVTVQEVIASGHQQGLSYQNAVADGSANAGPLADDL